MMTSHAAWLNSSVPDMDDLLAGLSIDRIEFDAWLAAQFCNLRFQRDIKQGTNCSLPWPTPTDEIAVLEQYAEAVKSVAKFQSINLPAVGHAQLVHEAHIHGIDWNDAALKLQRDAASLHRIAARTLGKLKATLAENPPKRGRPSGSRAQRDEVLAELVERLEQAGATRMAARTTAEAIFTRARIEVPTGERSVRRATRRTGQ